MIRAAVFDLDGTLTESKQPMAPAMGALLAQLFEKMPVAIFSGAALHQFEQQFLPFLPESAKLENLRLFPTSAAQCYEFKNNQWRDVYKNDFTSEEKEKIIEALQQGIAATQIVDSSTPKFGERIEDRGSQISFSALGQEAPVDLKKTWDPDKKKRTPLWSLLTEKIPEYNIAMNAATTIDITKKGINKAYGVRRLSEITGIPITEMIYIGDALFPGGNDAIVTESGIPTRATSGPGETAGIVTELINGELH